MLGHNRGKNNPYLLPKHQLLNMIFENVPRAGGKKKKEKKKWNIAFGR